VFEAAPLTRKRQKPLALRTTFVVKKSHPTRQATARTIYNVEGQVGVV
jgi:hypothetical protein